MKLSDDQLSFCFDFVLPHRGALTIRQVATCLGRVGAATAAHPMGKVNEEFVIRLIDEGKLISIRDKPKHGVKHSYRVAASSVRLYVVKCMTLLAADYRQTVENAALNLPPSELRKLAEFATRAADSAEEKAERQEAMANGKKIQ